MSEPDPEFDATHPSGHILFRSCRGGYLHSVALAEPAMDADAQTLARAILLTADVSYLKALMQVRAEIIAAGHTPSDDVAGRRDLELATEALAQHRLRPHEA
ncbi:DUF2694 family protein [Mycolicibacterium sp.]|uniref:DUF2694 family protein n=1 Tax=Mycolicibacterium sp. TaxID=2320850 RepID=UPI0037C656A3